MFLWNYIYVIPQNKTEVPLEQVLLVLFGVRSSVSEICDDKSKII